MLERPKLTRSHARLLAKIVSLRPLLAPAVKENRLGSPLFEATQTTLRNSVCTLEMLANTYWRDRQSHFLMQSHPGLRACQQATESVLTELALMLKSGDTTAADQAIGRLQEAAAPARWGRKPGARPGTRPHPLAATSGSISISSSSSPTSIACWGWCCNPMPSPRPAPDRAACNRPQKPRRCGACLSRARALACTSQGLLRSEVEGEVLYPRLQGGKAVGVDGRAQVFRHHLQGPRHRDGIPIGALGGDGIEDVGGGDDARLQGDRLPLSPLG